MTDNIVSPGVYTIRYSRDRSEVVTVIGTRKIGKGHSVLLEGNAHMKLKDFQRSATPADSAALIEAARTRIEPTNGSDEAF